MSWTHFFWLNAIAVKRAASYRFASARASLSKKMSFLFEIMYAISTTSANKAKDRSILMQFSQGRRQEFVKEGADARREMPTLLRSEVWGLPGVCQRPMTTCSGNDWFNFLSLLIPLFSFFFLSLFLSLLSLTLTLLPTPNPCLRP